MADKTLKLIKVKALKVFTLTVAHGQFHGDPESRVEKARHPRVPDYAVERLVAEKSIEAPDGFEESAAAFSMKHIPVGRYEITGPGLDQPVVIRGKAEAEAALEALRTAHAAAGETAGAPPV